MTNLNYSIIKYPNNKLLLKSTDIVDFDKKTYDIINIMRKIMIFNNGIGLAAVQIGLLKNICIIFDQETKKILEFINPIILFKSFETFNDIEGCLSIPNNYKNINRPQTIIVKYFNKNGKIFKKKFFGLNARILCHEIDHLNGILFIDHITKKSNEDYSL